MTIEALLSLGGNTGDRKALIDQAVTDAGQIHDTDHGSAKLKVRLTRLIVR